MLKERRISLIEASSIVEPSKSENESTEKDTFKSPILLAEFVNKYCLNAFPIEENYKHLPSEEIRKDLNITYEQRERYIREISILRIAGISLFIKQYYDDEFWLKFSHAIYPLLLNHLYADGCTNKEQIILLANDIEKYVAHAENRDEKEVSLLYMHRVYDDNDNYGRLLTGGVGFLSVEWLMDSYMIFRETYFEVTQGMSYENYKLITEAIEK